MKPQGRIRRNRMVIATVLILVISSLSATGAAQGPNAKRKLDGVHTRLAKEVRHELVMLPFLSIFDNLAFRVEGIDTIVLKGQVTNPTLKKDAESAVRRIEGVGKLVNEIEVLPLSPNDDRIRRAAFRSIYSKPGLDRYALSAVPSIHIIVKNGNITLEGIVATQADKNLAGIAANEVTGAFSVTNHLEIESR